MSYVKLTGQDLLALVRTGQVGYCMPAGSTSLSQMGRLENTTSTDDVSAIGRNSTGTYFLQSTSNVNNNVAKITSNLQSDYRGRTMWSSRFALPSITSITAFFGFCNSEANFCFNDDDSGQAYYGLQFSTNRADTTWQWSSRPSAGGVQTLHDSGVTVVAQTPYTVEIYQSSTGIQGILYDGDGGVLDTYLFPDTPTSTTLLIPGASIRNRAAIIRQIRHYGWGLGQMLSS